MPLAAIAARTRALTLGLGLGLLLALAPATARADSVVVARVTKERGGTWIPCGTIHAVGWVVYELIKVIEGPSPGARFVAIHSCPADSHLAGELRLKVSTKKPSLQPRLATPPTPKLPVFYVVSATPETAPITRKARQWLGQTRASVEATLKPTGQDGEWVRYGEHLALRYVKDRVVALRARVSLAMTCESAAAWLGWVCGQGRGFPLRKRWGCEWPGISEKHRLAPGLAGRLEGTLFEVWRR